MLLNFPSAVSSGTQYLAPNGVTYIFDGSKWVGYPVIELQNSSNGLFNNGYTIQLDNQGNLQFPEYTFPVTTGTAGQVLTWPSSGRLLAWTTPVGTASTGTSTGYAGGAYLQNIAYRLSLNDDGSISVPGNIKLESTNTEFSYLTPEGTSPVVLNTNTISSSTMYTSTSFDFYNYFYGIYEYVVVNGTSGDIQNLYDPDATASTDDNLNWTINLSAGTFLPNHYYYFEIPPVTSVVTFDSDVYNASRLSFRQDNIRDPLNPFPAYIPPRSAILSNGEGSMGVVGTSVSLVGATPPDGTNYDYSSISIGYTSTWAALVVQQTSLGDISGTGRVPLAAIQISTGTNPVSFVQWGFNTDGTMTWPDGSVQSRPAKQTLSTAPPPNPQLGDVWYDINTDIISVYTRVYSNSGEEYYWLDTGGPTVANGSSTITISSVSNIFHTGSYAVSLQNGVITNLYNTTTNGAVSITATNITNLTSVRNAGTGNMTITVIGTVTNISIINSGTINLTTATGSGSSVNSSRVSVSTVTSVLSIGASTSATIKGFKGYALYSITVSTGSWITLYSNVSSLLADATRSITTDPTPGSGVIAESISTVATTTYFTPAIIGFSAETVPNTNIPIKIYNNSSASVTITTTLTLLQLES